MRPTHTKRWRRWLVALAIGLGLAWPCWVGRAESPSDAATSAEEQRRLRRVVYWQNKMKLLKLQKQGHTILDAIDAIDRRSVALHERLQERKDQAEALQKQIKKAHIRWKMENLIAEKVLQQIQPRLRMLYRLARLGKARLLLGARDLHALSQRWRAMQLLSVRDLRMLRRYQAIRRKAAATEAEWKARRARMLALMKSIGKQQKELSRQRIEKASILRALYRDIKMHRRILRSLRGSGRYIQSMVSRWQKSEGKGGLALKRGQLPWPISNFSPYCEEYKLKQSGSMQQLLCEKKRLLPRSLACPLGRSGVVLEVPEGTAVLAVAKGTVAAVGYRRGYGRLVIVDHGESYYSVYAHLSRALAKKGDAVNAGYPIGLVGATGTLGEPRLYFELRHGLQTLSPELWLTPLEK